jgi:juvenile hormone diol kinase
MLTDLQRRKLTRLFHVYDMDDSGYLMGEDYERIAQNFCRIHDWQPGSEGYQVMHESQAQQWQAVQALADSDQDGRVSLEEYLAAYSAIPDPDAFYAATVQAIVDFTFDYFDRDQDGYMTAAEFAEVYAVFDLAADDAHRAFTRMDVDGDGRIPKDEGLRLVREFYLSDDPDADGNVFFGE